MQLQKGTARKTSHDLMRIYFLLSKPQRAPCLPMRFNLDLLPTNIAFLRSQPTLLTLQPPFLLSLSNLLPRPTMKIYKTALLISSIPSFAGAVIPEVVDTAKSIEARSRIYAKLNFKTTIIEESLITIIKQSLFSLQSSRLPQAPKGLTQVDEAELDRLKKVFNKAEST